MLCRTARHAMRRYRLSRYWTAVCAIRRRRKTKTARQDQLESRSIFPWPRIASIFSESSRLNMVIDALE